MTREVARGQKSHDSAGSTAAFGWEKMIARFDEIRAELADWVNEAERCGVRDVADLIQTAKGDLAMAEDTAEAHYGAL